MIHSLVEIIHAFQSSETYSNVTISLYLQLLLCQDPVIAFSAKQALCKVRVFNTTQKEQIFFIFDFRRFLNLVLNVVGCSYLLQLDAKVRLPLRRQHYHQLLHREMLIRVKSLHSSRMLLCLLHLGLSMLI